MTGIAQFFRLLDISVLFSNIRFRVAPLLVVLMLPVCYQPILASDAAKVQELAAPCLACHSIEANGATRVGPSLFDIGGRALAGDGEYAYSNAFSAAAGKGLIWNRETLDQFLENPAAMIEGTVMNFPGLPDPDHRSLLIDWLLAEGPGELIDLADANFSRHSDVAQVLAMPADVEYGEYLAGECLTCHQQGDAGGGVPPIHGLTSDYFVHALLEYQSGVRANQVMQSIAGALGLEEMAALAAVFTRQIDTGK